VNILLASQCNRRCSYCFAQERVSFADGAGAPRRAPPFISEESFRIAVDFARRGGERLVGILGGEPSLHPRFLELLEIAWEAKLHTKVFSNGLWREAHIAALEGRLPGLAERMHVVLNVNGPARTPPAEQRAQEALLARLGPLCSLSFNISRADFEPSFLVDLVERYHTQPAIRLGVAAPLARMENEHVPIAEYRRLAPTLLRLADACDAHDIQLGFDCGFVLCMFTPEELGRLQVSGAAFKSSCGPAIDVGTDLSTWSCFPLSTFCRGRPLTEFRDLADVVRHFRAELRPLFQAGALPACAGCRHRRRAQCSGGCGAHVYRSLNP
jgi:hypothetical protein